MLVEIRSDTVNPEGLTALRKIWYHSPTGDLFLWKDAHNRVVLFQATCFERDLEERNEWWLEWSPKGIRAGLVDSKEIDSRVHDIKSPVVELSAEKRALVVRRVRDFVVREGQGLSKDLKSFIEKKLKSLQPSRER